MKRLFLFAILILGSVSSFATETNTACDGSIGSLKNVSLVFTGAMIAGDIDNGYKPYCAASIRFEINGAKYSIGDLESVTGSLAGSREIVVQFENLPEALSSGYFKSCGDEGFAGSGACIRLRAVSKGSQTYTLTGHPGDMLTCHEAPLAASDCR